MSTLAHALLSLHCCPHRWVSALDTDPFGAKGVAMNTTPVFSRWFANVRHRRVIYLTSLQQPHGFCLCANCIAARLLHLNTRLLSSFEGEGLIHCDSLRSHCYKPVCPCVRHWSWLNSFPAGSGWTEVRMLVVCVLGNRRSCAHHSRHAGLWGRQRKSWIVDLMMKAVRSHLKPCPERAGSSI